MHLKMINPVTCLIYHSPTLMHFDNKLMLAKKIDDEVLYYFKFIAKSLAKDSLHQPSSKLQETAKELKVA